MHGRRLFEPGTLTWDVNHEPAVFLGGGRALLLQVAHPLVAAGVGDHSDFESHPWRRLARTLDTTLKIAFAPEPVAKAAASRLANRHRTVRGEAPDGRAYDASDPALSLWVWATLVDSALCVYGRCVRPLGASELDAIYAEQKRFAIACGVPPKIVPADWPAFSAYCERVQLEELALSDVARRVCEAVMSPFRPPWRTVARPFSSTGAALTATLLPDAVRRLYGLGVTPRDRRVADVVFATWRVGSKLTPRRIRYAPVQAIVGFKAPVGA